MIGGRRVLALIPARAGSKGLPGKNIRPMCGKPLIGWTIERALQSKYIDTVLVSTDGEEIAGIARDFGAEVPFLRPEAISGDKASSYDVIDHALDHYAALGSHYDYLLLLEPTSPLREPGDLDALLEKLMATGADSIISLGEAATHPSIVKRLEGDGFASFFPLPLANRRQDNEPAYFPYGVGYAAKTNILRQQRSFYLGKATWYQIKRYQCYEIDDIYDFLCVEAVMRQEWNIG